MKREDGHRISPKCPTLGDRERRCGREEMLRWMEGMERTEPCAQFGKRRNGGLRYCRNHIRMWQKVFSAMTGKTQWLKKPLAVAFVRPGSQTWEAKATLRRLKGEQT